MKQDFFDDLVAIQSANVIDEESYNVERIDFMPNTNGSMGHYFASEKEYPICLPLNDAEA